MMGSDDNKEIVARKMDALRDKILWSPDALEVLLSLLKGEELSWSSRIPDTGDEGVQKYIWTAYFTVKDYMKGGTYEVSSSYLRDLVLKLATQMAEDAQVGSVGYVLSSRSQGASSLSTAFMQGKNGLSLSLVDSLLKSLDEFRKVTFVYREDY